MEKVFRFQDIFNVDELQELMHALSESLEVGLVIRGPEGERYTDECDHCDLCRMIKQSAVGQARCEQSDKLLSAYKPVSPHICNCKSAGLVDAGINIMIGDVHIASILVGQVRLSDYEHTDAEYRALARELGVDEDAYMNALALVPRKTKRQFECILETLSLISKQLSQLGYNNLHQKVVIDSMADQKETLRREKEALMELAERDALTGLYNRRGIEAAMRRFDRDGQSRDQIYMVSVDVNNLKLTNDIFGHESGDRLLKVVGENLKALAEPNWLVARCGGDEFRVLATGVERPGILQNYCEWALRNCRRDTSLNIPASFSYGIAHWEDGESIENCFSRADEIMYHHKNRMQEKQKFPDYILEKLYDRELLNKTVVEKSMEMATSFARYMGYDQDTADRMATSILYQDLGMIQVPEHVMISVSNEMAWKPLHAHPMAGYLLARQFDKTYRVADIILQTHESWDGQGYPQGLKGEDICLEARVTRLISNYVFWGTPTEAFPQRSPQQAREKVLDRSGSVFDPTLVNKLLRFLDGPRFHSL